MTKYYGIYTTLHPQYQDIIPCFNLISIGLYNSLQDIIWDANVIHQLKTCELWGKGERGCYNFNRPGVAKVVLQKPLSLIH